MPFRLPARVQQQLAAAREREASYVEQFAGLDDGSLAQAARYWMDHCAAPRRFEKDAPVYDSTFWHVIVPEMLRRLELQAAEMAAQASGGATAAREQEDKRHAV